MVERQIRDIRVFPARIRNSQAGLRVPPPETVSRQGCRRPSAPRMGLQRVSGGGTRSPAFGWHWSFRIRLGIRRQLGSPPETRYKHIHVAARSPTSMSAHGLRRTTQPPTNCAKLKQPILTGYPWPGLRDLKRGFVSPSLSTWRPSGATGSFWPYWRKYLIRPNCFLRRIRI